MNNILSFVPETLLANGFVEYYGQPIGVLVAKTEAEAQAAAKMVRVKYTDVKKPILKIEEAIEAKSFHQHPHISDRKKGDAETAIQNSKHRVKGEYRVDSSQYNFFLEVNSLFNWKYKKIKFIFLFVEK